MAVTKVEPDVWSHRVPNMSPTLIIISIIFLTITTVVFAFRQVWRWSHQQRGWDDFMAACAYIILHVQTIFGCIAAHYGFGKHMADIKPTLSEALKFFYLYQVLYKLLGGFTKLTFCMLYLRIFKHQPVNIAVIVISLVIAAGSLAFSVATIFQCHPIPRVWNRTIPGYCFNNTIFWYSHATFNIVFDIVVFILPIPLIQTLKLARGQKTGIISVFCLGAFVITAAIARMVMLRSSAKTTDPTWGSMAALIWTEIEANTSVICCCMPALRVPFVSLWNQVRGRSRSVPSSTSGSPRKPPQQAAQAGCIGQEPSHTPVYNSLEDGRQSSVVEKSRGKRVGGNSSTGNSASFTSKDTWSVNAKSTQKHGMQNDHSGATSGITNTTKDDFSILGEGDICQNCDRGVSGITKSTELRVVSEYQRPCHLVKESGGGRKWTLQKMTRAG